MQGEVWVQQDAGCLHLHLCSYFSNRWFLYFLLVLPPKHLPQWRLSFLPTAHWLFRIFGRSPPRSVSEDAEAPLWLFCSCLVLCILFQACPSTQLEGLPPLEILKIVMNNVLHVHDTRSLESGDRKLGFQGHPGLCSEFETNLSYMRPSFKKKKTKRRKVCLGSLLCDLEGTMAKKYLVFGGGRLKHDWFQSQLTLLTFYLSGKSTHGANTTFCHRLKIYPDNPWAKVQQPLDAWCLGRRNMRNIP